MWLPSKQVETSTLAAYRSYPDKHFIPVFGRRPMGKILPSEIQRWVTTASAPTTGIAAGNCLSAASVRKNHTMLHSVFERALRDRVVTFKISADVFLDLVRQSPEISLQVMTVLAQRLERSSALLQQLQSHS